MILFLLLKAYQPGLFDEQVTVTGHATKKGTYVQPYQAKRKKRERTTKADIELAKKKAEIKRLAEIKNPTPKKSPDLAELPKNKPEAKTPGDMFAEPADELIREHERLVKVLRSPATPTTWRKPTSRRRNSRSTARRSA